MGRHEQIDRWKVREYSRSLVLSRMGVIRGLIPCTVVLCSFDALDVGLLYVAHLAQAAQQVARSIHEQCRYAQILSIVFGFSSGFDQHSAEWKAITTTFRGRSNTPRMPARMPLCICKFTPGAVWTYSIEIVNFDVDFVTPSCILPGGTWKQAPHTSALS